jgi:ferredoxin
VSRSRAASGRGRRQAPPGGRGGDAAGSIRAYAGRLRVNPIACEAHGMCAELLPELISLDPWGYPLLSSEPVPVELAALAKRAVAACPTLALQLAAEPETAGTPDMSRPPARSTRA